MTAYHRESDSQYETRHLITISLRAGKECAGKHKRSTSSNTSPKLSFDTRSMLHATTKTLQTCHCVKMSRYRSDLCLTIKAGND